MPATPTPTPQEITSLLREIDVAGFEYSAHGLQARYRNMLNALGITLYSDAESDLWVTYYPSPT